MKAYLELVLPSKVLGAHWLVTAPQVRVSVKSLLGQQPSAPGHHYGAVNDKLSQAQ